MTLRAEYSKSHSRINCIGYGCRQERHMCGATMHQNEGQASAVVGRRSSKNYCGMRTCATLRVGSSRFCATGGGGGRTGSGRLCGRSFRPIGRCGMTVISCISVFCRAMLRPPPPLRHVFLRRVM
eukprot:6572661-Prymnesium_polylepis.1